MSLHFCLNGSKLGFKINGKTSREIKRLNSSVNWLDISLLNNFKIYFVGIILGPTAFRGLERSLYYQIVW